MEMQALEACGGDNFCLFDIAATGRMEVGLSTLAASQELEEIIEVSRPGKFNTQKVTLLKSMHGIYFSCVFKEKYTTTELCGLYSGHKLQSVSNVLDFSKSNHMNICMYLCIVIGKLNNS